MSLAEYQALNRFGLGRRGNEELPSDPVGWLERQVDNPDPAALDATLPSCADALILWRESNKLKLPPGQSILQPVVQADVLAQANQALTTPAPFRERLVQFWTNHFTVSTRGVPAVLVGPYVREAIRPNVTGTIVELLLAVMRHPAMLMYLDNGGSVGPASVVGLRSHRGLNENLARECLELHTVSPASGYTQADVTAFARVLTGWSFDAGAAQPGFVFRAEAHEPGEQTIMGHRFPPGEAGGVLALEFLASHPAMHHHLATKLVRHFVADVPPPEAVHVIEAALRDSAGDLAAASLALVHLPQAWQPLAKLRSPADFVLAALRGLDLPPAAQPPVAPAMALLGQPLWTAPLPNGWPDTAADWAAPEAVMRRLDWSYLAAGRAGPASDPASFAEASLGPMLQPATLAAMHHAGSRRDALTLLLTSPEFQRR